MNEPKLSRYPHIILTGHQPVVGKEDSILYGKLSVLLSAMRNRANQVVVNNTDDDEVVASLSERKPDELLFYYKLCLPNEENFPVLLISFVGKHHGRLFQAHMDGEVLHISQSKLYSFKDRQTAPLDLFARYPLSRPNIEGEPYGIRGGMKLNDYKDGRLFP